MRSLVIRKYLVDFFIYTIAYVVIALAMDWIFNGVVIDYLYITLPSSVFQAVWANKFVVALLVYTIGLLVLSLIHLFRLTGSLKVATEAISQEDPFSGRSCPEELKDFSLRLKEFKQQAKDNEAARKTAERQKSDLIVYLAHDLKTPLTSVIGYISLLAESPDMPFEQRAKYTDIALDKAYRLEHLINEFFDITRLNLQTVSTQKTPINLTVLLLQVISEFYPMLEGKGMAFTKEIAPDLKLNGDADKLARVFENLLRNAINYSEEGASVRCTAMADGDRAIVKISNTGTPIPPEKLSRIFEQFYRLDDARQSSTGGTGLGLTIAKQIVELHQGSITAESNEEATVFTVTLPL